MVRTGGQDAWVLFLTQLGAGGNSMEFREVTLDFHWPNGELNRTYCLQLCLVNFWKKLASVDLQLTVM